MWCGCVYLLATCSICQIRFLGSPPYWPVRCESPSAGPASVPASCGTAVCTGASQPKGQSGLRCHPAVTQPKALAASQLGEEISQPP